MKKTVLITGANKSIGLETARQLLAQGYFVYIGSRDKARGEAAVKQLNEEGYTDAEVLVLEVTDAASVAVAVRELETKIPHLDVLINNAGILGTVPQEASVVSLDNVRTVFETNFFGVIQTTQGFLPLLKKSPEPRVVNVSSDLGSLGYHSDPQWRHYHVKPTAYASSKTALNAYTVMLAYELRETAFKVNAVNPGYTATDFNNFGGYKTIPEGAAPIVKYATIPADGPTGKFFSEEGESPW